MYSRESYCQLKKFGVKKPNVTGRGGEEKRACRTPTDSVARCSQKNKQQTNKNYKTSPYSVI